MRIRTTLFVMSTLMLVGCATQNSGESALDLQQRDTINRMQAQIADLTEEVLELESEVRNKDELIGIHEATQVRLETQVATLEAQVVMVNDIIEDYALYSDVDSENSSYDVLSAMDHALDFTFDSLSQFEVIPHYEYGGADEERDIFNAVVLWYSGSEDVPEGRQLVLVGPATVVGDGFMIHGLEYRSMDDDFRTYDLTSFESLKSIQFNVIKENDRFTVVEYIDEF